MSENFEIKDIMRPVDHIEDIDIVGEEILIWDGCQYQIDYIDVCADTGFLYMANGTQVEMWAPLQNPIKQN